MKRTGINFAVEALEPVTLHGPPLLAERDLMSPYVWQESTGRLGIMVRAVPTLQGDRSDTGVIWAGWSDDGCTFEMDDAPAIVPGPGEVDVGGVEDPTVLRMEDGYVVYYTGVQADFARGNMLYATGQSLDAPEKQGDRKSTRMNSSHTCATR